VAGDDPVTQIAQLRRLFAQRGIACGQRGWKRQPDGGLSGLGTSPGRMISSRRSSGWLGSAAENSASV
jgi:hypothetical protein